MGKKWRCINVHPIIMSKKPAPDRLLNLLRCTCKTGCKTLACTCRKLGVDCSIMCKHCDTSCTNTAPAVISEDSLDDIVP